MSTLPRIQDFDDPSYNPFEAFDGAQGLDIADVYGPISQWQRQALVHPIEYKCLFGLPPDVTTADMRHFTVFGYDLAQYVYSHPEIFSNKIFERMLGPGFGRTVTTMDAPEHTQFRRIFQRAFMPGVVAQWGDSFVQPVVDDLMKPFVDKGKADLVVDFTSLFPFHIIYRQLGLPSDDIRVFHKLAVALTVAGVDVARAMEASAKLGAYYEALTEARYAQPGGDLVSALTQVEVDGERLPKDVLISFMRQLINAAGDTTYRGTSNLLVGLLTHPDQLDALRRDRSLLPAAIEEGLRWEGPVMIGFRTTTRDTELGGMAIPKGAAIHVVNGSASRDSSRYEDPEKFDIFRKPGARHMTFAYGAHVCIGQHLARLEMTRALNALLDSLPNLRLDPGMPPPQIRGCNMRHPQHLHVRFD
ncbi:cytochrome P450 [Paraburkholderia phymatum]|uniref:cytochrome P450 n=1 Tax=Paraburkholderia phymatum TaxID=148447 RepID=UPI00317A15EB